MGTGGGFVSWGPSQAMTGRDKLRKVTAGLGRAGQCAYPVLQCVLMADVSSILNKHSPNTRTPLHPSKSLRWEGRRGEWH